jgi:hypothetical protein
MHAVGFDRIAVRDEEREATCDSASFLIGKFDKFFLIDYPVDNIKRSCSTRITEALLALLSRRSSFGRTL